MQSTSHNVQYVMINSGDVQESGTDSYIQNETESMVPGHQIKTIEKKRRYRERKRYF